MLAQLNLYVIIALIIVVIALGGGWHGSNCIKSAEIDTLVQRNAFLTSAVETNERTITQMIADAAILAASNQKLSNPIMAIKMEHAKAWQAIDALDLESTGDLDALEAHVNSEFERSVEASRMATGK